MLLKQRANSRENWHWEGVLRPLLYPGTRNAIGVLRVICWLDEAHIWGGGKSKANTFSLWGRRGDRLYCPVQSSSVAQLCPTLCDPMDCSMPDFPVHHQLLKLAQTHVHWVNDALQPSHPLSSPSPPAFNLSQDQGLFKWVSSSHQVTKVSEFQLQHQSFQWIFRTDFL